MALGLFTLLWGWLSMVPYGHETLGFVLRCLRVAVIYLGANWNPLLTVSAATGMDSAWRWSSFWLTDWLALLLYLGFMIRQSTNALESALGRVGERDLRRADVDHWIHHDPGAFTTYSSRPRPEVQYDRQTAVLAFDAVRGHRIFLHPFIWSVAINLWLFLVVWALLVPELGRIVGIIAVLIPATGALLLMSGGVAASFGWERQQERWPALAATPINNASLALAKIWAVVRPMLWVGIAASATALILGMRGALPWSTAAWMALHVLTFPITLAFVSAVLALTTPSMGEAVWRWAVLGALPAILVVLPWPLGGLGGVALPFSPPLLVLLMNLYGPEPELIRAAWISLALQVGGIEASLWILSTYLRRWTVGETP